MKKFIDTHKGKNSDSLGKYEYFKTDKYELLVFDYLGGNSIIFIKGGRDENWIETTVSSGGASGTKRSFSGENVFGTYNKEIILYVHGEMALIKTGLSMDFNFLFKRNYKISDNLEYLPLPNRLTSYRNLIMPNGEICIMAREDHIVDYKTHIWIGQINGSMRKQVIEDELKYRDGGTTYITTNEGQFYFETPFNKNPKKTWISKQFNVESLPLNITSFEIDENNYTDSKYRMVFESINVHPFK